MPLLLNLFFLIKPMQQWPEKRQEILKKKYLKPTQHSNLKKKLSYIARIKDTASFTILDIQSEDLSRFVHEIVQTILSIGLKKREIIQYIVELCHYFGAIYLDFNEKFLEGIKNKIREISEDIDFLHVYFYYELMRIGLCPFEIKSISKMFEKMKRVHKYKLCLILSIVYSEEHANIINDEDYSILDLKILDQTKHTTLHFLKRLDDLSFEKIFNVMKNLKEEKMFEKEYIEKNYVKVIEVTPSEFKFYELCEVPEQTDTKFSIFLTQLLWFINSPAKIDYIAKKQINNFKKKIKENEEKNKKESKDMKNYNGNVILQITKYIPNLDTQPVLARFISWFQIKTLISFLETDSNDSSLLFLCELSKFNVYSKYKIIEHLEEIIRNKNIDLLIMVLNSIGRFYLHRKETNFGIRKLFEKIKILRNESNGIVRAKINDTLSQIMNIRHSNESLDDFFSYMINENRWKGSRLESILTDEHLLILFMKPWIFEDFTFIYKIAKERNIHTQLSKLLYESFLICVLSGRLQQSISYITLFSYFESDPKKITERIISLKIQEHEKAYLLMAYLENKDVKKDFINDITVLVEYGMNTGVKNHYMHWVSKYNLKVYLIDLDKEIELLKLY